MALTTPKAEAATTSLKEVAITPAYREHEVALAFPSEMLPVVKCESGFQQFWPDGKPRISSTDDVGILQIHIPTWLSLSKKMGLDIVHSAEDNIKMGQYIYRTQGIKAWDCSEPKSPA